jgi:hypothetical protein
VTGSRPAQKVLLLAAISTSTRPCGSARAAEVDALQQRAVHGRAHHRLAGIFQRSEILRGTAGAAVRATGTGRGRTAFDPLLKLIRLERRHTPAGGSQRHVLTPVKLMSTPMAHSRRQGCQRRRTRTGPESPRTAHSTSGSRAGRHWSESLTTAGSGHTSRR